MPTIQLFVDGEQVEVPDYGDTLLGVLRDQLGIEAVKDGCSPQGQCGCCTVLVDDAPRVACVTPARRVAGRRIETAAGLATYEQQRWAEAFVACGASQCGFCTPGIVCRFVGHERRGADLTDRSTIDKALAAHLCRCTGWQTIREAASHAAVERSRSAGAADATAAVEGAGSGASNADMRQVNLAARSTAADAAGGFDEAVREPSAGDRRAQAADDAAVADAAGGFVRAVGEVSAGDRRAQIETGGPQQSNADSVLGAFRFGADGAPAGTLTAVAGDAGDGDQSDGDQSDGDQSDGDRGAGDRGWVVAGSLMQARREAGKVQGRRTTLEAVPPIAIPEPPQGEQWDVCLATCWTEPGYLESDAAWCLPDAEPTDPLANGGAFGGKATSSVRDDARRLAAEAGVAVRVLWSREDTVRRGPKRPPLAAGLRADGTGIVRVAKTPGAAQVLGAALPRATIEEVDVAGPPTSMHLRAAVWAEAQMLTAALDRQHTTALDRQRTAALDRRHTTAPISLPAATADRLSDARRAGESPAQAPPASGSAVTVSLVSDEGARVSATVGPDGIAVRVHAGDPLDAVVLRSYVIGAAHMAWSWVTSESLAVDEQGEVQDLTIRSFGIARSADTPDIDVSIESSDAPPIPAGDTVFAAAAAATWLSVGTPPTLPTGRQRTT